MWEIRAITEADADLFRARVSLGFGRDPDQDDASAERFRALFDLERTYAAFDGDDIVGTVAAFPLGLTVPGGAEVRMGGTTVITVKSTHRRRGVLREMMSRHFADIVDRGEPLAGLWASEGSIYARFGYGPATFRHVIEAPTPALSFHSTSADDVTLRMTDAGDAAPVVRQVYEMMRGSTHGALTRSEEWWDRRILADPESWRGGKTALRIVIAETAGTPAGYAIYRQKAKWDDFVAGGEVEVVEVIAPEPRAHRALWKFLASIDLFPNLDYWNMPVDDAMPHLVSDMRRVRRTLADGLWVRLMDVPRALEARRYEVDGALTFVVDDASASDQPAIFRLVVEDGTARCDRTDDEPELRLSADVLGHLYLGGGSALAMAAAGRLDGSPAAVSRLDRMFRTSRAPWCPEVF